MLNQLSISDYAIVDQLDLIISEGMTVITGETGAGKSIILDALGLAIGDRADSQCVKLGAERAEIRACFDLNNCSSARKWLDNHDLASGNECILRRIITKDGRSRSYINGTPSLLSDLKTIGELLIDIHGQHEHQSLLKKSNHQRLLDDFAGVSTLAATVTHLAIEHDKIQKELHSLLSLQQEREDRLQLLSYQLKELVQLGLTENETHELEQDYRKLTNATETLTTCHRVNIICSENESGNVLQQLSLCINSLSELSLDHQAITQSIDMLSSAQIQVEEAIGEINHFVDYFDADPQRIQVVEERLSAIYDLARKHRIQPDQLIEKQQTLADELEKIQCHDELSNELSTKLDKLFEDYHAQAKKLSEKRQKSALKLEKIISSRMRLLGMSKGLFRVALHQVINKDPSTTGLDDIEFLVTTNPGQPLRQLVKVASGGELSRISLAIQVATSQTSHALTLVFDEVDVGIGGGTAEIVGNMLRELGEKGQVLCVTHQPQVASRGHHHVHVDKKVTSSQSSTSITLLAGDYRIKEVARMLGGVEITSSTLAHAREMLED
ncbi:MAG: DNA repair protein RecN [Candidatus Endonucleobacter sp. (ex Gigantidas childressi)]|nr:DNA repair protein RecN [Candidatus Endonucleobacter sp. (ex Gigantidas childressi)]